MNEALGSIAALFDGPNFKDPKEVEDLTLRIKSLILAKLPDIAQADARFRGVDVAVDRNGAAVNVSNQA